MLTSGATRRNPLLRQTGTVASITLAEPPTRDSTPASRSVRVASDPHTELFRLTDTAVVMLVMGVAFLATNHNHISDLEEFLALRVTMKNALLFVVFVVVWQRIFSATNRPSSWPGCTRRGELVRVSAACTLAALVAALVPLTGLSGSFGLPAVMLFWVSSVPASLAVRQVARAAADAITRVTPSRHAIVVGSGPLAYAAYRRVRECHEARCEVVGFVDTNDRIVFPEIRNRHLGELHQLEAILMHRNVDVVVIALPVKSHYSSIQEAIRVCERVGVESRYLTDIFHGELAWQEYDANVGIPSVAMKVVHDDVRTVVKRAFDVVASLLGLIALSPVLLFIALAIKATSRGPIFFVQERYGLNRRTFRMYKFRTMVANAEALQNSLEQLNEAGGPVFKIKADPRVTRVGHWLRRTSLDELPQLLNVLKGDMSLVGPRPLPLRDVRHFSHGALMRRFSVRPGVTGLWQVSGRSNLGFDDWIRLDVQYIDRWSIGLDLKILLLTIPAVFRGAGAC